MRTLDHHQLINLVQQYGDPLYVYDTSIIERQYQKLTQAFGSAPSLQINYACKALSNLNILRFLHTLGSSLDTVSLQEVELGLMAGFAPEQIIYTPNSVSLAELEQAAALGVQINIDNLSLLEQFGAKYPQTPVCVRINPHIMAGGNSKISVGHVGSKFGISIHQLPHILTIVENTGMHINGVHMHTGSDILDISSFLMAADILLDVAMHFGRLDFVDFGSGFKVPYKPHGTGTDIEELGTQLSDKFQSFCTSYGKDLTLMFEPGKFLVSEAGLFLTKVNSIKQTTAAVFASVNTGLNHLIRPMFYDAYHHIENISNPDGADRFYDVVGYICETDTFASNRPISEIREGDILCFRNAGAYCYSMSSNYNSRYRPAEVMLHQGEAHLIRERETMEDLTRGQKIILS